MRTKTIIPTQDLKKQRADDTCSFLYNIIFRLSTMDFNNLKKEDKDFIDKQKTIFNYLFDTLTLDEQKKTASTILAYYNPALGLEKLESLLENFLYIDNGLVGAMYHPKRNTPLAIHLYEIDNPDLMRWAIKKYNLDFHELYEVTHTLKIKDSNNNIITKEHKFQSNLLDSIFSKLINNIHALDMSEKSIEKLIYPLDMKTFKSLEFSSLFKNKISNINFLNKSRRHITDIQKMEIFFSYLTKDRQPFIANGFISSCLDNIFYKDEKEVYFSILAKTQKEYADVLSDKNKASFDEIAVNKAIQKLMRVTGDSLIKARKELGEQYKKDTELSVSLAPNLKSQLFNNIKAEIDSLSINTYKDLSRTLFIEINEFDFMTKIGAYLSKLINNNQHTSIKYNNVFSLPPESYIHRDAQFSPEFLESVVIHLSTFCLNPSTPNKTLKI